MTVEHTWKWHGLLRWYCMTWQPWADQVSPLKQCQIWRGTWCSFFCPTLIVVAWQWQGCQTSCTKGTLERRAIAVAGCRLARTMAICYRLISCVSLVCGSSTLSAGRPVPLLFSHTSYNTLILPHLHYCAVVWGINYNSNTKRIMLLQKRAVRIIDKKLFISSQLFVKHKILKFHDIVKEHSIMILLAHRNNTLPSPISKLSEYEEHKKTRSVKHFVTPLPWEIIDYLPYLVVCQGFGI